MNKTVLIRGSGRQASGLLRYFSVRGYECSVVSSNVEALCKLKTEYRCKTHLNFNECLQFDMVYDVVVIASKPSDHLDDLKNILKLDAKIIIIEKPLAHNLESALEIQSLLSSCSSKVFINYPFRKQPLYYFLENTMKDAANGKLIELDAMICFPRNIDINDYPGCWWIEKSISGGGTILQVGIHWINLIFSLLKYDVNLLKASMLYNEYGVDDTAWGLWETKDGTTVVNVNLTSVAKTNNIMIKLKYENAVYIYDNNYMYSNLIEYSPKKNWTEKIKSFLCQSNSSITYMPIENLAHKCLDDILLKFQFDRDIVSDAVNDLLIYKSLVEYQAKQAISVL